MTSKERVIKTVSLEEPDRVPIDCWLSREAEAKLLRSYGFEDREELLQHFNVDIRTIDGPRYIGPEFERHADGSVEDLWGVPRIEQQFGREDKAGIYKEVSSPPLADAKTVRDIEQYPKWPSPDWFDYSVIEAQCDAHPDKALLFVGDRLNRSAQLKPAMYLRGVEQIFIDLAMQPELVDAIVERIVDFYLEYNTRVFDAANGKLDIFMMGDDFGMQRGLLCSREMWLDHFAPGLRKYINLAKRYDLKVAHHSCGAIVPIIHDFIGMGLDILNPIQPRAAGMVPRAIKAGFGDRIAFHGSIDIQRTMPLGTPNDVRAEVKDRIDALAPGGGFIICTAHNIQADVPLENITALFEACIEYGEYAG